MIEETDHPKEKAILKNSREAADYRASIRNNLLKRCPIFNSKSYLSYRTVRVLLPAIK